MSTITELLGTGNVGADRTVINDNFNSLNAGKVETEAGKGLSEEDFTTVIATRLASTSGTNTGDQDLSTLALKSNVLELNNTTPFTPTADNQPATKKYVDDNSGGGGIGDMTKAVYDPTSKEVDAFSQDNMDDGVTNKNYLATEQTKLAGIAAGAQVNTVDSVNGNTGIVTIDKASVGLGSVDNTSDADKPVSTAQQTALDLKSPIESPTFTGVVGGVTKAMVGLGSVDNTSDLAKPISTLTQTALDLKADLVGGLIPVSQLPSSVQGGITVVGSWNASTNTPDLSIATPDQGQAYIVSVAGSTPLNGETNWRAKDLVVWDDTLAGNWFKLDNTDDVLSVSGKTGIVTLVKSDVGLTNVDDTSDADKPVSTATQTALDLKASIASPTFTGTVSGVTKAMVGLSDADNTSDANKPVSTAQQTALNLKADISDTLSTSQTTAQSLASDLSLAADKVFALEASGALYSPLITLSNTTNGLIGSTKAGGKTFVNQIGQSDGKWSVTNSSFTQDLLLITNDGIITGPATVPTDITTGVVNGFIFDNFGIGISSQNSSLARTHKRFYNPNGLVGSISTSGTATAYNTSSDPRLKDFLPLPEDSEIDSEWNKAKDSLAKFTFKSDPSKEVYGFDAHKAIDANLKSGLGTEGEGPRDMELGEVYDTVKVSDTIPAVEEVVDEETGEILVEAVDEIPEVWEEKKVTPAGVDQSKLVPLLLLKIDQLDKKDKAKDDLIASLIKRLDDAGIA